MAKTPKVKHDTKANPRSRASKRATSPSIDVDKSVKDTPRTSDASPFLGLKPQDSKNRIGKKTKVKPLKRGQRVRMEKGAARAEAVMNQLEKKLDGVDKRLKKRKDRRKEWDGINEDVEKENRDIEPIGGKSKFAALEEAVMRDGFGVGAKNENGDEDEWVDEVEGADQNDANGDDEETKEVDGVKLPAFATASKLIVADRGASVTRSDADDEFDKIT